MNKTSNPRRRTPAVSIIDQARRILSVGRGRLSGSALAELEKVAGGGEPTRLPTAYMTSTGCVRGGIEYPFRHLVTEFAEWL